MNPLGLYIHFPFCKTKCLYCSFYSIKFNQSLVDIYCNKITSAILSYPFNHTVLNTVYFGGGTPSLMGYDNMKKILSAVNKRFILNQCEVTLEANPIHCSQQSMTCYRDAGINRISFGVQSSNDLCLKALGRSHTFSQAVDVITQATDIFNNISVDLMLGIPHQSIDDVESFVSTFSRLNIKHISSYMLKIEKNTPFYSSDIKSLCPNDDLVADIYTESIKILEKYGYSQYEISNFAKCGYESKHNNKYWLLEDYIGIGPTAHSCIDGVRYSFTNSLDEFLSYDNIYQHMKVEGTSNDIYEVVMLKLRLISGINISELSSDFPNANTQSILLQAKTLENQSLLKIINDDNISLTPSGFLISNSIILYLLEKL